MIKSFYYFLGVDGDLLVRAAPPVVRHLLQEVDLLLPRLQAGLSEGAGTAYNLALVGHSPASWFVALMWHPVTS